MTEVIHLKPLALSKRWGVRISTLAKWRSEGTGPVYLKICGRIRYREADVDFYEDNCLHLSTAEKRQILEKYYAERKQGDD